jgi:hypothetical protein
MLSSTQMRLTFTATMPGSLAGLDETAATSTDKKDVKENYHGNINTKLWLKYLQNRLIPAFRKEFPGRKMILIMDNAS